MQNRVNIENLSKKKNETVIINAWIHSRRDQGKMIFLDFRDGTGLVQGVILPGSKALELGKILREEFVVEIEGKINARPEKNIKKDILNGDIEIEVLSVKILNESKALPFNLFYDTIKVDELLRLKYRYLDMRSKRLRKNIINRSKTQNFIRNFLHNENYLEVETPILSAPTPEGARSFVVPSRVYKNKFYSLPQSPQQYKQFLMIGGLEKYFQFAKCMRDEDGRGDRQPEFTQLDMEMSFADEEDVMKLNEKLLIEIVKNCYPEKRIQQIPFPKMTYKEAMEKYGNDRPDIREDKNDPNLLAFLWVVDFPMFEKVDINDNESPGEWTFTHNPFSKPKNEYLEDFNDKKNIDKILSTQYDIVLNGFEIGGGSIRNHKSEMLKKTFKIMGYNNDIIKNNFGHLLEAMEFGAPPHGGIAWGFDRLLMIMEGEPNIREVIPFSKTSDGKDLLMKAPGNISKSQKKELGL